MQTVIFGRFFRFVTSSTAVQIRNLSPMSIEIVPVEKVASWDNYFNSSKDSLKRILTEHGSDPTIGPYEVKPVLNSKVSIWEGGITSLAVDAIVNAANNTLLGGGGVDGAIHRDAGPELRSECSGLHGCDTGDAKITKGYKLPAKFVIHTVGPRGEKKAVLESCYNKSLNLVVSNNLRTVAFPCISTGIYGYPQKAAAKVAISTTRKFLEEHHESVDRVIFCLFMREDVQIYKTLMQQIFPSE